MKYTVSNTIDRPFDEVVAKFKDKDAALNWMEGLKKMEPISGEPGEVGAKTRLTTEHKNKTFEMVETILENRPDGLKFAFDSSMGYNEVNIVFEKIDENHTRQTNTSEFRMGGMMKIMGVLFKGMFKKQSLKFMDQFKAYAEK